MSRKVFVTFLGTGNYGECKYERDGWVSEPTRFIQEATLDWLQKDGEWGEGDEAIVLLTDDTKSKNWVDNGQRDRDRNVIEQAGLETVLRGKGYKLKVNTEDGLPNGNNEEEIMQIFRRTYDRIEEGDELYFDLTHGFRYLPMLLLVLGQYSSFLKGTKVRSITYGNFDGRDKSTNTALIVDLMPMVMIQDWTFAAGLFDRTGDVSLMKELCEAKVEPILRETRGRDVAAKGLKNLVRNLSSATEEWMMCRGRDIINGKSVRQSKEALTSLEDTFVEPMNPLINKIRQKLREFGTDSSLSNCLAAAKWCYAHKHYQQAATILEEFLISAICERHGIDMYDEKLRIVVTSALTTLNMAEENWKGSDSDKEMYRKIHQDEWFQDQRFVDAFENLEKLRNDYNHSGMRKEPQLPKTMKDGIKDRLKEVEEILKEKGHRVLLNISNHPSKDWGMSQRKAAEEYGVIEDMKFPDVGGDWGESRIESEAEKIVREVMAKTEESYVTVHVMGEMTLTMRIVEKLKERGIECIASTTERDVDERGDGVKEVRFKFVRFRRY